MTAPDRAAPLVSIGIPLYRARPFVDRIVDNIGSIDYPNLEFLLADQHGLDDAVAVLRERIGDDPRVRFFESTDELDWIGNYNFLLRHASGEYLRLLSQDDVLPVASITAAVTCLEGDRTAVLVDGPMDTIDGAGNVIRRDPTRSRPQRQPARWPVLDSLALFAGVGHDAANLGVVRRAAAVDNRLFIPRTHGLTGLSVRVWLFGISLRGRVHTVPGYVVKRCVHPDSFTAVHARRSPGEEVRRLASYIGAGVRMWNDAEPGVLARLWGPPLLFLAATVVLPLRRGWQRFRR